MKFFTKMIALLFCLSSLTTQSLAGHVPEPTVIPITKDPHSESLSSIKKAMKYLKMSGISLVCATTLVAWLNSHLQQTAQGQGKYSYEELFEAAAEFVHPVDDGEPVANLRRLESYNGKYDPKDIFDRNGYRSSTTTEAIIGAGTVVVAVFGVMCCLWGKPIIEEIRRGMQTNKRLTLDPEYS